MYKRDEQCTEEKRKVEEYEKNPMINLTDSLNRSKIGDLDLLTKGGCLNKVISIAIILVILSVISRCTT